MAQARRAAGLSRGCAAVALLLAVGACGGGGGDAAGPSSPSPLREAVPGSGCDDVIAYPIEGTQHLRDNQKGSYRHRPPTSGNHASRWAPTGTHAKEVSDEAQVHNLEHGAVVIQYVPGEIPAALLDELRKLATRQGQWVLLAPRSADRFDDDAVLAFTAWGVGQSCDDPAMPEVLEEATEFVRARQRKGPERVAGRPISESPPSG